MERVKVSKKRRRCALSAHSNGGLFRIAGRKGRVYGVSPQMKSREERLPGCFRACLLCSIVLLAAGEGMAAVGDDAQLISVLIQTGTQVMPRMVFTQSWTLKNIGTNIWTPGQSGYTMNLLGTDSLAACRLTPNTVSSAYHPSATIRSGQSIPPGGQATFSLSFVAPEIPGPVTDTFRLNGASSTYFGPTVSVQVVVMPAGSTNQYDRARAVSYANNYAGYVCTDGYFWTNGSGYGNFGAGAAVPKSPIGDDCAHFVSCCIGTQSAANRGGGLKIPSRVPPTYGEPGAARLVNTVLIGGGYAKEVFSLRELEPGDLIGWNWEGDSNIQNLDHVVLYVGNGLVAAHAASCLGVSATTWYQNSEPNWRSHFVHIFDAPTLASWKAGNRLVLSWGTNWTSYALYSATSLAAGATWTKVSAAAVTIGRSKMVTNSLASGAVFYRLVMP
jgi:cell wall-associated NlpC family hydrolase